MSQTVKESPYTKRLAKLDRLLQSSNLDALILNPSPSLIYLSGLHFHLMERPVIAIFPTQGTPTFVLPELETGKLSDLPYPSQVYAYGEDPQTWFQGVAQALSATGLREGSRIGIEARHLRVLELRLLEQAAPKAVYSVAETLVAELRLQKDPDEVMAMRKAVQIAQSALLDTLPLVKAGMTEKELASELTLQLLRHGSQTNLPFSPIVASGPNSANPHAIPGERPLQPGDILVIDWGAGYNAYFSDLTRTFAIQEVFPDFAQIARLINEANAAARAAAQPGTSAEAVDAAAREVITKDGYGSYFIHRTGHGLGLEVHEEPYIRAGNPLQLAPGMTFTIEPGIYLPARGGVRIEDDILITADGSESLSDLQRDLIIL